MHSQNGKTLVIQHGTLIDGSGRPATVNDSIVIAGNRIRSVGRFPADVRIEDQDHVQVIDATDQWIMPGLIDGHCHLSFGFPQMATIPSARGTTNPGFSALRATQCAAGLAEWSDQPRRAWWHLVH
jgi:imidazolonepropionase-like amidohydrolase